MQVRERGVPLIYTSNVSRIPLRLLGCLPTYNHISLCFYCLLRDLVRKARYVQLSSFNRQLFILTLKLVKIAPEGNVLPRAVKTMSYAARSRFKLDHAKPSYQQTRHGRTVPWTDHFVDEMKRGLIACRVM